MTNYSGFDNWTDYNKAIDGLFLKNDMRSLLRKLELAPLDPMEGFFRDMSNYKLNPFLSKKEDQDK